MLKYIQKYIQKDLFQLIFHVTFRCNARCIFCFNWRNLNKDKEKELSLDEIEKISKSMPEFPWLLLSGGEPFLRQDLVAIIEIFCRNNKIKHLTLPTNGLLPERIFEFTKKLLEDYKDLTITLSFSLDDFDKEHDKMRGMEGCYDKVIKSFDMLKILRENKKLNIKFNTVASSFNYKHLEELIKRIRSIKPDMHTIDFIRGDVKDKKIGLPPAEELDRIIELIKENNEYYQGYSNIKKHSNFMRIFSKSIQQSYLYLFKEIKANEKQVIPCLAYRINLVLYPYGDVSFCEPLPAFANFRNCNYDYQKIINLEHAKKQKNIIRNKKCYCYHPCYQYLNILFTPKLMIKGMLKNVF